MGGRTRAQAIWGRCLAGLLALALSAAAAAEETADSADEGDAVSPAQLRMEERLRRLEAVTELFDRQTRLWRLSYPLLYAAVDLCPERVRASAGFSYANAYLFQGAARSAASVLGYDHRVSVVAVGRGSAAAAAGVQRRDVLVAIGDWQTPIGEGAVSLTAAKLRDALERYGGTVLTFARGPDRYQANITPDYICDLQVLAAPGDVPSAYADSERVVVFHGLMDFLADDGEMAAVIAREIANSLLPGSGIAGAAGEYSLSNFFNWGMESEPTGDAVGDRANARDHGIAADYVGTYLLARAGYDHRAMIGLWRRVAAAGLADAEGGYAIPDATRTARIAAGVAEVDAKLASRSALTPEPGGPPAAAAADVASAAESFALAPAPPAPAAEAAAVPEAGPPQIEAAPEPEAPAVEVEGLPWRATETAALDSGVPPAPGEPERVLQPDESMHRDVELAPLPAPPPEAEAPVPAPAAAPPPAAAPAPAGPGFSFAGWFGR